MCGHSIEKLLEAVKRGDISIENAMQKLKFEPFEELDFAKIDHHRQIRQGIGEVVYGASKTPEQIVEITNYLSNIINNFDDMAFENLEKSYSICQLVNEILHDMKKVINKNQITIVTDYKIDNKVFIDKFRFAEAIKNILNNSIEAFIENKIDNRIITIKTEDINSHLRLKIEDNAGGIDEKILRKIFEPYFTTKHQSQGTGLGLTNTYKIIVEMHKYSLSIDNCQIIFNNKKYKGLCVSITF